MHFCPPWPGGGCSCWTGWPRRACWTAPLGWTCVPPGAPWPRPWGLGPPLPTSGWWKSGWRTLAVGAPSPLPTPRPGRGCDPQPCGGRWWPVTPWPLKPTRSSTGACTPTWGPPCPVSTRGWSVCSPAPPLPPLGGREGAPWPLAASMLPLCRGPPLPWCTRGGWPPPYPPLPPYPPPAPPPPTAPPPPRLPPRAHLGPGALAPRLHPHHLTLRPRRLPVPGARPGLPGGCTNIIKGQGQGQGQKSRQHWQWRQLQCHPSHGVRGQ